jgi:glycosyltransferase involved in cell wall biosynthesis
MLVATPDRQLLLSRLADYDAVWIHTVRTANAFRVLRWPHSILDVDDLHSQLYSSMAAAAANPMRRALDLRMARIWRARERRFPERFDSLAVCSERDRDALSVPDVTHVVRNGFDAPAREPVFNAPGRRYLGFIGLLRYQPNRDGVEWFLREVWPIVKKRVRDARLRLVGQGCDRQLLTRGPDVDGLGYLDNPAAEIATWSAAIVPIRFGAGTRVKIAEAFSRKCPVVSTSLGAFGYEVQHERELLLADSPEAFAESCVRLLDQPDLARRLTDSAWRRFEAEWSWRAVARSVEAAVTATLWRHQDTAASRPTAPADACSDHPQQ